MDLEHRAIARLRLAAEMSEAYYGKPLIITVSGGKDSDICLYLAAASGIRYEVMHNHTSVDAPEFGARRCEMYCQLPDLQGRTGQYVDAYTAKADAAHKNSKILLFGAERKRRRWPQKFTA